MLSAQCSPQSEGNDSEDEMSDGYADSAHSDAPATPRNKKSPSSKQRRAGQTSSTPPSQRLGTKRLKKASDQASYAITETISPASSGHPGKGKPAGQSRGAFVGSPSPPSRANSASSPRLSPPASSPPPLTRVSTPLPEGVLETGRHTHHGLRWLYNDRRDKERRTTDDDNYNPRTLYVPPSFIKAQTPAMQQWWLFKSENMDTVLFFKVRSPCRLKSQFCGCVSFLSSTESVCSRCIPSTLPGI